ncbi:ATP-binding cassette domain-containing protein [Escherichia coli]
MFVGPSGCGKSTLLRMIAGLETITSGDLFIGEKRMNDTSASRTRRWYGVSAYAPIPPVSSRKHVIWPETGRRKKEVINQRVNQVAEVLQLAHLLDRKPKALSGGQRQRVAIGRTLVA